MTTTANNRLREAVQSPALSALVAFIVGRPFRA